MSFFEARSSSSDSVSSERFVPAQGEAAVNKDLGLKAKAKAKAKDLSHKTKAKATDSDPKVKAKAKDLGPKAKGKDSRYQGPIFHRSSPYIICSWLTLCACFYVRVLHFVSL